MVTCKILRDAFFGHNRESVFAALPDLPKEAFGACRTALLIPFAERAGFIPTGEIEIPKGVSMTLFGIGKSMIPNEGQWMEETETIPDLATVGCSIKEHLVGKCIIAGNRYGCCWFIRFI